MSEPLKLGYQLDLVCDIYRTYEVLSYGDPASMVRPHLGASLVGEACSRKLWYTFRWAGTRRFPGRMLRLFQTGHLEEARFTSELRKTGVIVHEVDANNKFKQFSINYFGGHFSGSLDGVAIGFKDAPNVWHVVEYKTHSAKSFERLMSMGVKEAKFTHYSQVNTYQGGTGIQYGMYLAKNKDTDEIYAERVKFEPQLFQAQLARAKNIIFTDWPPEKISPDADSGYCRFCDFKNICHENEELLETCRSCSFSRPLDNGTWVCLNEASEKNTGMALSKESQFAGCKEWEPLDGI